MGLTHQPIVKTPRQETGETGCLDDYTVQYAWNEAGLKHSDIYWSRRYALVQARGVVCLAFRVVILRVLS